MTCRPALVLFLVALPAAATRAEVIVDQSVFEGPGVANARASQVFPDFPTLSTFQLDDFTTVDPWLLTTLTAFGRDGSVGAPGAPQNLAVTAEIRLVPDINAPVVLSSVGGSQVGGNLIIDFGGQLLPAGTYWLTAFVTRPLLDDDDEFIAQWGWNTAIPPVAGQQSWYHNPGGGFAQGPDPFVPRPGNQVYGDSRDMSFRLEASPVPEPSTIGLLGAGLVGLALRRRRAART